MVMDQPKDERTGADVDTEQRSDDGKNGFSAAQKVENSNDSTEAANQNQQAGSQENAKQHNSQGSTWQKIVGSFKSSIGQIVFGMEDGTVSIFGLVFGMAATATSNHAVFVAGATGAAAAAVSMMAGAYLDVESTKAQAKSKIQHEKQEIHNNPQEETREIRGRLQGIGFDDQETNKILSVLKGKPDAMLKFEEAYELQIGTAAQENPVAQAIWMLLADLIAASIPVLPFAFFPLSTARWVSIGVTATLLLILGFARGIVAKTNVPWTMIETLLIAALAGAAGVGIGLLFG